MACLGNATSSMESIVRILWIVLVILGLGTPAAADMVDRVQQRYQSLTGFRAFFTQKLTHAATKKREERLGAIAFAKPRLLRWETTSPEEELVVVGPTAVWEYLPEEGVAYQYTADQLFQSKTILRLLSGEADFRQDFTVADKGLDSGLHLLELTPREPEAGLTLARVWVREDGFFERLQVLDFFGNENFVQLKAIELDPAIDPVTFAFSPPAGVRVLHGKTE